LEAAIAKISERIDASPWQGKDRADRDPYTAPVQRVGTFAIEQDRIDSERGGTTEEDTQILVVVHALAHDHPPCVAQHRVHLRQLPPVR
jgi:hypothetical protein